VVSTHSLPQRTKGALQVSSHVPPLHELSPFNSEGQALLHAPQFCTSLVVSTHAALQFSIPSAHESVHLPDEQTLPAGQWLPQPPQCAGLLVGSTHCPAHST
jgi:hypothetical protein